MNANARQPDRLEDRDPLPDLSARLRLKPRWFRRETVDVPLYELDRYGGIIKTDRVFEPGDTISFDLHLKMPFEDASVIGLEGLVTERVKHWSNYFYYVDIPGVSENSDRFSDFDRILELVSRKLMLRERRAGPAGSAQTA